MDLFSPTKTCNLGEKRYALVVVDDFTKFSWAGLPATKDEALKLFPKLCRKLQNKKGFMVSKFRSDHGDNFENENLRNFVMMMG